MAAGGPQNTFLEPLWRRIALVGFVAVWLAFELFYTHDSLWTSAAGMMLVYGIWQFFLKWPKPPPDRNQNTQ